MGEAAHVDIVVADMGRSLAFYRTLGLDASADNAVADQIQIYTQGGTTLGLVTEALVRRAMPHWVTPSGSASRSPACAIVPTRWMETYARVTGAGYTGLRAPWDAVWGQRYAFLQEPDGNRVDIFAPIAAEGEEAR